MEEEITIYPMKLYIKVRSLKYLGTESKGKGSFWGVVKVQNRIIDILPYL